MAAARYLAQTQRQEPSRSGSALAHETSQPSWCGRRINSIGVAPTLIKIAALLKAFSRAALHTVFHADLESANDMGASECAGGASLGVVQGAMRHSYTWQDK
eukprot:13322833-Alexandrium_andersonii.AAC.1